MHYCKEVRCMKFNCPKKEKQFQKGKNPSKSSVIGAGVTEDESSLSLIIIKRQMIGYWIRPAPIICVPTKVGSLHEKFDGENVLIGNDVPCTKIVIGLVQIRINDCVVRT